MSRTKVLDQGQDTLVAEVVIEAVTGEGFSPEESIAGLVQAIILLSEQTGDPDGALDEATDLLAATGEKW